MQSWLPYWAGITSLLLFVWREGCVHSPRHHNGTSSSPSCSTWHHKSSDTLWAHPAPASSHR
jgi:hypothetical protein